MAAPFSDDLALAQACARGESSALTQFEASFAQVLLTTARRFGNDDFAKEVAQAVRERLLVSASGSAPRIASYAGDGPLAGYLQAATVRVALNKLAAQKQEAVSDDAVLDLPSRESDPELNAIKQRFRAEFKAAFAVAMSALEPDLRAALRLYYLDGLALADLGRLYGWSVPTASRRLAAARAEVLAGTRAHLGEQLKLTRAEVDSVLRLLESKLSVDALSAG